MSFEEEIDDIRKGIREHRFNNEAAISQGVILRILNCLGWNIFDSSLVSPEFKVGEGRVDYALCHPSNKPVIIIESKFIGNIQGSETQLFNYAFHQGIPMAILTDGQEWNFFLPGEQGSYFERCVYKLDLIARNIKECCHVFDRYLKYSEVVSGAAISNARKDYQNVRKGIIIKNTLPKAWSQLMQEQDEILVELLADKVETLCGFKPTPDEVRKHLDHFSNNSLVECKSPKSPTAKKAPPSTIENSKKQFSGFIYRGETYILGSAIETLFKVFEVFAAENNGFLEDYAALPKHGRKRRYLSRNKYELYPDRSDLCEEYSKEKFDGWWIGTNYSRSTIKNAIAIACEVSGNKFGVDLKLV